jgi:hypothetical protein
MWIGLVWVASRRVEKPHAAPAQLSREITIRGGFSSPDISFAVCYSGCFPGVCLFSGFGEAPAPAPPIGAGAVVSRRALVGVLAAASLALSSCAPSGAYRYRLTAKVRTPDGVVEASGVRSFQVKDQVVKIIDTIDNIARGEALVLDLGRAGVLFVTLYGWHANESPQMSGWIPGEDWGPSLALARANPAIDQSNPFLDAPRVVRTDDPAVELLRPEIPILIRFRDLNDPATIEFVNPENLSETFGPNAELVSVVAQVTDEDITSGQVERYLPWIKAFIENRQWFSINMAPKYNPHGYGPMHLDPHCLIGGR